VTNALLQRPLILKIKRTSEHDNSKKEDLKRILLAKTKGLSAAKGGFELFLI
jgi:hypothetical protein